MAPNQCIWKRSECFGWLKFITTKLLQNSAHRREGKRVGDQSRPQATSTGEDHLCTGPSRGVKKRESKCRWGQGATGTPVRRTWTAASVRGLGTSDTTKRTFTLWPAVPPLDTWPKRNKTSAHKGLTRKVHGRFTQNSPESRSDQTSHTCR